MFGRMMNNYYYGKSGKGDFRKEDLPHNRRELFRDTLKTRLSSLCRINLLYMLIFLPTMIVMMLFCFNFLSVTDRAMLISENDYAGYVEKLSGAEEETTLTEEQYNQAKAELGEFDYGGYARSILYQMLAWLVPCIAITGPFTAGLSYVTRNWARDEHAFIWTDFKDAVKANWKQSLILSAITSVMPLIAYTGWEVYGQMAKNSVIMMIPQVLVVLVVIIWSLSITYMHPMAVSYDLKTKDLIRNGLLLGVARLPMSVAIRLLHCVPFVIGGLLMYFWNPWYGAMILFGYYLLIGFSLSRFVTASYTNAVFDRFINPRIEGAKVNQGLHKDEDEEDDETGEGETEN
ncbi:MAG: YesL family protein [Clostridia bacterium]|nr:YesL family protein [Clostridia bacterium]